MKILQTKTGFFISVILYRLLLDKIYIQIINPVFGYAGFSMTFGVHTIVSWFIFVAFSLFILRFLNYKDWFIANVIILFFLIRFVPNTSIMGFIPMDFNLLTLECVFWICLFLFAYYLPKFRIKKINTSSNFINYFFFIAFALVIIFISGYYTRFRLNFGLSNVYDLRFEARQFNMPTILKYLWAASKNMMPLLFIWFLSRKNKTMSIITGFLIFLNFSIDGLKSALFKLFLALIVYFFYKKKILYSYSWYFVLLCFFAMIEPFIIDSTIIGHLVIRRVLFVPSLLDYYYYDYISQVGPIYFHNIAVPFTIGDEYFSKADMRANNGLFSDAYTNLGEIGCIIHPFLLILLCKLFLSVSKEIDPKMLILPVILIVLTFNSSFFTTGLLTHGIFLLLVYLYFLKPSKL
jgi:hypothetical protein